VDQSRRIDNASIAYELLGKNSNSFAYTLMSNCDITPQKPTNDLETPGWGISLIGK